MRREEGEDDPPFRRVLDLYAGTGALGIEALSRGAEHADFVETNPRARATIQLNLQKTGFVARAKIHAFDAARAAASLAPGYDLILADPPYSDAPSAGLPEIIGQSDLLAEGGVFVLESSHEFDPPGEAGVLRLDRVRRYGTTLVAYYRRDRNLEQT